MNKTVLITGASAGIGIEFVGVFAKEKYDLVITARICFINPRLNPPVAEWAKE